MAEGYTMKEAAAAQPPFRYITGHDLLACEFPPREMLLAPWLPERGLAMLYGPRGIGKTHLTLGIAYAVATGGRFLRWYAPRPRRVLVIDGEMPATVLQSRLAAIVEREDREPEPDNLRFLAHDLQETRGINLADAGTQAEIEPQLAGCDLIIADNISTLCAGGKENEADSWEPMQQWALQQRREGRAIVFMHHAGKGGGQRGTSRREDVLDTVIALRKPSDANATDGARFELHFEKARGFHGDDAKAFEATLGPDGWTTRDLADADMARVVALSGEGLSARDIAEELGAGWSKSRVNRLQAKARELGLMGSGGHA